jgi:hypothetical protein
MQHQLPPLGPSYSMTFEEQYPKLWILFGTCFFVGVEDGLSDEEVLAEFRTYASVAQVSRAQAELTRLVAAASSDWQQAAHEAWRYFATLAEIRDWLVRINGALAV